MDPRLLEVVSSEIFPPTFWRLAVTDKTTDLLGLRKTLLVYGEIYRIGASRSVHHENLSAKLSNFAVMLLKESLTLPAAENTVL